MSGIAKSYPDVRWWIDYGDEEFTEFHQQTLVWIRDLGLDPERLGPKAAVVFYDGAFELHVNEIVRSEVGGKLYGDRYDPLDEDSLLAIRRIIPVAKDSWPTMPDRAEVAA